jgi:hypothetical protein
VVGSEVPTTLLDWIEVLDSNGFHLDKTARLLFRHEMEGQPEQRILIATARNSLGLLPPAPDDRLICGVNRKGNLICKIISVLGL